MKNFHAASTKCAAGGRIYCTVSEERKAIQMEYDARTEERIWQRVRSEKQDPNTTRRGEHLPALVMEQLQLSAAYLQLSRLLQGKDGAVFVRLAREARSQAVCLKGILALVTGYAPQITAAPVPFSTVDAMQRHCYSMELRLLKEYQNRHADAEYGPVFERLAQRGWEHCYTLLEMIGKTGKGK